MLIRNKFHLLDFELLVELVVCRVILDMRAKLGPAVFGRVVWQQHGATCYTANMVSIDSMVAVVDEP